LKRRERQRKKKAILHVLGGGKEASEVWVIFAVPVKTRGGGSVMELQVIKK